SWSFGDLPREVALDRHTTGFPGLHDSGGEMPGMRLWPAPECALAQHRLGAAALYRFIRREEVDRLLEVIFSGRNPTPASTPPSAAKSPSGARDDFGSLAAAFGGAARPVRAAVEPTRGSRHADKAPAGGRFLSPAESLLLSRVG